MYTEKDVDQRSAQLADRYMRIAPQMNSLQRLEQPITRAIANGLVREVTGAKKPGGAEDFAAFLGRTRLTGSPGFGGTYAPVQPVHQAVEKARLDGLAIPRDTAHQRALVQN